MNIIIDVAAYYEWRPHDKQLDDCEACGMEPQEAINQLLAKGDIGDKLLHREVVASDTYTTVALRDSEIEDLSNGRDTKHMNTKQRVAWYLSAKTMPHHAPQEHWRSISVDGEPELERFLQQYFGLDGSPPPSSPPVANLFPPSPPQNNPTGSFSHFLTEVHRDGELIFRSGHRHNLTTDTAVGYTNRRDWQSKAMGGGLAPVATMTGAATSVTATSLTNTGAAFPTAGQALAGCIVAVGPNSAGAGSTVFGVITSNTATVLTVDQWYNPGTLAAGTTPNGTATYQVLPGQAPAFWLALTADAVAPAATDTTLASELTTGGFARAIGTWAHTAAATTYTLQKVFNATATQTINKEAVFGAAVSATGVMPFESAEPSPPTLVSGDQLTQTITVTVN